MMTSKEKFEYEIRDAKASRIESIKDAEVWAALADDTVLIFCHPDCEHWDKYDCGTYWNVLTVPQVIQAAFCEKESMPEQVLRTLDGYYSSGRWLCGNDILQAIVWLWNNTPAFDDIWGKYGTRHEEYEDDRDMLSASELAAHREFFGEMLLVFSELSRAYRNHYSSCWDGAVADSVARQMRETGNALLRLVDTMLGCDEMLEKRYSDCSLVEWASGAGSIARRVEACYWLMSGIVREMTADMEKDEDVYASGDQRVERHIYEFCQRACSEIEELRTEENADV